LGGMHYICQYMPFDIERPNWHNRSTFLEANHVHQPKWLGPKQSQTLYFKLAVWPRCKLFVVDKLRIMPRRARPHRVVH